MNFTNSSHSDTLFESIGLANPCPRQRSITRPLLFIHNYALFFFGSLLNFFAFMILIQRSLRRHSTFAYLAFLSLSNGLLSLVHYSKWMFNYYFSFLFESVLVTCRFHRFSSDFLTHVSLFTLICVNIDRARTVTGNLPGAKYHRSKFHMVAIRESIIAGILFAFHFHWLIKYGYYDAVDEVKTVRCNLDESQSDSYYFYFLQSIYPPFELLVFFCFPLLINICCTGIIVRSLCVRIHATQHLQLGKPTENKKNYKTDFFSFFTPKTAYKSDVNSCLCFRVQCRRHTRIKLKFGRTKESLVKYNKEQQRIDQANSIKTNEHPESNTTVSQTKQILYKKQRNRRARDINLSAMLIGLNVLYLLLNLPFNVHQTFAAYIYNMNSDRCNIMFNNLLLDALQQTFFSTNFFLYVLANRRFREEFYKTTQRILSYLTHNHFVTSCHKNVQPRVSKWKSSITSRSFEVTDYRAKTDMARHNHDAVLSDIQLTETFE